LLEPIEIELLEIRVVRKERLLYALRDARREVSPLKLVSGTHESSTVRDAERCAGFWTTARSSARRPARTQKNPNTYPAMLSGAADEAADGARLATNASVYCIGSASIAGWLAIHSGAGFVSETSSTCFVSSDSAHDKLSTVTEREL